MKWQCNLLFARTVVVFVEEYLEGLLRCFSGVNGHSGNYEVAHWQSRIPVSCLWGWMGSNWARISHEGLERSYSSRSKNNIYESCRNKPLELTAWDDLLLCSKLQCPVYSCLLYQNRDLILTESSVWVTVTKGTYMWVRKSPPPELLYLSLPLLGSFHPQCCFEVYSSRNWPCAGQLIMDVTFIVRLPLKKWS